MSNDFKVPDLKHGEYFAVVHKHNGKDYDGKYAITSLGRCYSFPKRVPNNYDSEGNVKSWANHRGRWLKPSPTVNGNGSRTMKSRISDINRGARNTTTASLVLGHFVGPRPSDSWVAYHLDGDYTNNALINLVWVHRPTELVSHGSGFYLSDSAKKRLARRLAVAA